MMHRTCRSLSRISTDVELPEHQLPDSATCPFLFKCTAFTLSLLSRHKRLPLFTTCVVQKYVQRCDVRAIRPCYLHQDSATFQPALQAVGVVQKDAAMTDHSSTDTGNAQAQYMTESHDGGEEDMYTTLVARVSTGGGHLRTRMLGVRLLTSSNHHDCRWKPRGGTSCTKSALWTENSSDLACASRCSLRSGRACENAVQNTVAGSGSLSGALSVPR
jgi:hypothetical protein